MKNLFLIKFLFIFLFITIQNANANWLDDIWTNITTQSGQDISNQGAYGFSGGSFTMATPTSIQKPFNMKAPSVSAGCSGISIDMGAFQYNAEAIVNFLKELLQAAPGYAFNLAMQILCPSCTDLLNTMNQMAGIINGLQLDACGTLNAVGNALAENMASKSVKSGTDTGYANNWLNNGISALNQFAKNISGRMNDIIGCMNTNGQEDCPEMFFRGTKSLNDEIFEKLKDNTKFYDFIISVYEDDDKFKAILTSVIGDIYIEKKEANGAENFTLITVNPIYNSEKTVSNLINLLTIGNAEGIDTNTKAKAKDSVTLRLKDFSLKDGNNETDFNFNTISAKTNTALDEIEDKFKKREALKDQHLSLLMMFRSPVYKFLNQYSIDDKLLEAFIDNFKIVAGYQLMYEVVTIITQNYYKIALDLKEEIEKAKLTDKTFMDFYEAMDTRIRYMQKAAYDNYVISYNIFHSEAFKGHHLKTVQMYNNAFLSRHPVISDVFYAKKLY